MISLLQVAGTLKPADMKGREEPTNPFLRGTKAAETNAGTQSVPEQLAGLGEHVKPATAAFSFKETRKRVTALFKSASSEEPPKGARRRPSKGRGWANNKSKNSNPHPSVASDADDDEDADEDDDEEAAGR